MNFLKRLFKSPAFVIGLIFFVAALVTLPHYGINWDTINHLPRGQVYLRYFLTSKKDYSDFPDFYKEWLAKGDWYWQKENTLWFAPDAPRKEVPRISLYQAAGVDFNYFMAKDGGHPPLSDILSSFFNYVLFQKLGLINDIDSYRIYGILLSAILIGLIYAWVSKVYGKVEGLIAGITLALYPLFWSESHFNGEKDIPETAFWSFFVFAIWRGVKEKNWRWVLASGVFFGLAVGTKFNILFVPLLIIPWIIFTNAKILKQKWFWASSIAAALIGLGIFIGSWPFLWADPIGRIQKVIGFYQDIGLGESFDSRFLGPVGTNIYPLLGILYTTPIIILGLAFSGVTRFLTKLSKDKKDLLLLSALWLAVPIGRVVWPGTSIYGGLRQIMEYIPAMAILAGIGGGWLIQKLQIKYQKYNVKSKNLSLFDLSFCILIFAFLFSPIWRLHPNENVYFNSLIGGLAGAKKADFPFWGNTFGAGYRQGVSWINKNAEQGADVVLANELLPNIPRIFFRSDINFHNSKRSGYLMAGEYAITLPYRGTENKTYYDMYLRKFLEPVYEAKIDGVPVVTVWKNDKEHLKTKYQESVIQGVKLTKGNDYLLFDLEKERQILRLETTYGEGACEPLAVGYVEISKDGNEWERLPGVLPKEWRIASLGQQPSGGRFIEPFVGQEARFIRIVLNPASTCLKNISNFSVFEFK